MLLVADPACLLPRSPVCMIWTSLVPTTSTRHISTKVRPSVPYPEMRRPLTDLTHRADGVRLGGHHPLRTAADRRPLPILHLPDPVRSQVHPLGQRAAPRSQAGQPARQRRLRAQDLRLWPRSRLLDRPGGECRVYDGVRRDAVVPRPGDHAQLPELHQSEYVVIPHHHLSLILRES
jgi:hypothetical protein